MADEEMSPDEQAYREDQEDSLRTNVLADLQRLDVLEGISPDDQDDLCQMILTAEYRWNWRELDTAYTDLSAQVRQIHNKNIKRLDHRLKSARKATVELHAAAEAFAREIGTSRAVAFGDLVRDRASQAAKLLRPTIVRRTLQRRGRKAIDMPHRCELFHFFARCGVEITERYVRIALIEGHYLGNVVAVRRKSTGVGEAKAADAIRIYIKRACKK